MSLKYEPSTQVVLDEGDAAAADLPTLKPFGSAFYLGNAPYFVIPGWAHGLIGAISRSLPPTIGN